MAGIDVWNFELTTMDIVGTFLGFNAELRAGFGQGFAGFAPLTKYAAGQFSDGGSDGVLNFPALTVGDMFFDLWVDVNGNSQPELGEVFSNDTTLPGDLSAKMFSSLTQIPPDLSATPFFLIGGSDESDLGLYAFFAILGPPPELFLIDPNRNAHGVSVQLLNATHFANANVPEAGSSLLLLSLGLLGLAGVRGRMLPK